MGPLFNSATPRSHLQSRGRVVIVPPFVALLVTVSWHDFTDQLHGLINHSISSQPRARRPIKGSERDKRCTVMMIQPTLARVLWRAPKEGRKTSVVFLCILFSFSFDVFRLKLFLILSMWPWFQGARTNKATSISILLIVSEIVIIFRASFSSLFIYWTYGGELLVEVDVMNRAPGCKLKGL